MNEDMDKVSDQKESYGRIIIFIIIWLSLCTVIGFYIIDLFVEDKGNITNSSYNISMNSSYNISMLWANATDQGSFIFAMGQDPKDLEPSHSMDNGDDLSEDFIDYPIVK